METEKYQVILEVEHTGETEMDMEAFVEDLRCLKRKNITIVDGDFRLARNTQIKSYTGIKPQDTRSEQRKREDKMRR